MAKLTHDFFNGDTVAIAQALLGKYLVRSRNGELLAGRITETEAYVGRCDKACHAYNYRRTPRTSVLTTPSFRATTCAWSMETFCAVTPYSAPCSAA